ncbi:MAG: hypothetical protein C0478_02825, partial [Planctomyces sp.]|nr:hypothetical protein [Planctomyces sp.]
MIVIHRASGILPLMMSIFKKSLGSTAAATTVVTAPFVDQPETTGIGTEFFSQESPMAKSIKEAVQRSTRSYELKLFTADEVVGNIYGFAIRPSFFELVQYLPPALVESLKKLADYAAGHPEDFLDHHWHGSRFECYDGWENDEPNVFRQIKKTMKFWSFLRLREYFQPDASPVVFEPIKRIGTVSQSLERHGSIILLGEISWSPFVSPPIHLVRPDGDTMVVTIEGWKTLTSYRSDSPSSWDDGVYDPDFFREHITSVYKRYNYPVFSKNLQSPADAPPGTEVYVD